MNVLLKFLKKKLHQIKLKMGRDDKVINCELFMTINCNFHHGILLHTLIHTRCLVYLLHNLYY